MARESLGDFEHQVLLSVLRLGGEGYSVPIVLELEERTGREVTQAAVYIALRRMEKKRLLTSRMDDGTAEGSRHVRRYFKLTKLAMQRLKNSRRALLGLWEGIDAILEEA